VPRLAIEAIRLLTVIRSSPRSSFSSWGKVALSAVVTTLCLAFLVSAVLALADDASPLDGAAQLGAIFSVISVTTGLLIAILMRINRTNSSG